MEATAATKLPTKLFYNWATVRYNEQKDRSLFVLSILGDPFFNTCGTAEPAESAIYQIVANYWFIPPPREVKPPLQPSPTQSQHIPIQWIRFLTAVNSGSAYMDTDLFLLLKYIGFPYIDTHNEQKYHYIIEPVIEGNDTKDSNLSQSSSLLPTFPVRGLPHLFPIFCDYEPLRSNLAKSKGNYISMTFFTQFLHIMPFLYWVSQAYTSSIILSTPIQVKDSAEIDGKFAFTQLYDHTIAKGYKNLSQGLFDLVLMLCQLITHNTTLDHAQRMPFMNIVLSDIGSRKILLTDLTEFILTGQYGQSIATLDANDLVKQIKPMCKRFHQTQWAPNKGGTSEQVVASAQGVTLFKTDFINKVESFSQVHEFLTTPPSHDQCTIM